MRGGLRKAGAILLGAALLAATPVLAQIYSPGFEFLQAVRKKDGTKVNELLTAPGSTVINARDLSTGETALHIAVGRRDITWTQFLIDRGADPDIADKKDLTPLLLAVRLGFVEAVQALAKAGARVDLANGAGETPLISAVHNRNIVLIRILMQAGANPDKTDSSGRSARDYAELPGNSAVLGELERNAKGGSASQQTYGPVFR